MINNNHRPVSLLVVFLLFVLFPTATFAQDNLIPGSYRMEYGGIYKVIVDQSNRFLKSHWFDQEEILYDEGIISYETLVRRNRRISEHLTDWKHGTPWYYRRWWESFPEKKGGAPERPIVIRKGRTYIIADLGIIYLTNAFDLKWRGIEVAVDFHKKSSITLGVGEQLARPHSGWKFKFYPNAKVSSSDLLTDPLRSINRVFLNVSGVYTSRNVDLFAIVFNTWYEFKERSWNFGIQVALLQW